LQFDISTVLLKPIHLFSRKLVPRRLELGATAHPTASLVTASSRRKLQHPLSQFEAGLFVKSF
jgi:hypothetical protein